MEHIKIYFKNGEKLEFDCEDYEITSSQIDGSLTGCNFTNIKGETFLYIRLQDILAITVIKDDGAVG